jgi:hypothetical protein
VIGWWSTPKILCDGQSFAYAPNITDAYPTVLAGLLPGHRVERVATGATTYAQRAATAAGRVDHRVPIADVCILVDCGGQSDIIAAGSGGGDLTAAQAMTAMESYWTARRTAGVDYIVACTVPPMTAAWLDSDGQTQRSNLNPLILASSGPDVVADIAALSHAADPANTTYFYDGLHPTATLAAEFAATIAAAIGAL